jgi:hypothetical protein
VHVKTPLHRLCNAEKCSFDWFMFIIFLPGCSVLRPRGAFWWFTQRMYIHLSRVCSYLFSLLQKEQNAHCTRKRHDRRPRCYVSLIYRSRRFLRWRRSLGLAVSWSPSDSAFLGFPPRLLAHGWNSGNGGFVTAPPLLFRVL